MKNITNTKNVAADGHCGFRAVAEQLWTDGEESWGRVRADLYQHLSSHRDLYDRVFVERGQVDKVLNVLMCHDAEAGLDHWFCLPEMGHLVATMYNVALVVLAPHISLTYLPLLTAPSPYSKIISIGLVNDNHFIVVI